MKYLNLHDLEKNLQMPKSGEIHILISEKEEMEILHKNLREASHILLRRILSLYNKTPAETLHFDTGKHGKPYLRSCPACESELDSSDIPQIYFNLSHSGNAAAFIFSSDVPVGIDIEQIDRKANIDRIAAKVFLPEEQLYLKTLTAMEKRICFFRYWTRTESFLKGLGTGFSASFTDEKIQKEYSFWKIIEVSAPPGYICSAAYRTI